MRRLFLYIGKIASFMYPRGIAQRVHIIYTWLYTGYYSRFFKSFGKKSIISPKVWSLRGPQFISIGDNVLIGGNVQLTAWDLEQKRTVSIAIGDGCSFGSNNHITAINSIFIGNNVLTGKNVTITDNSHGTTLLEDLKRSPCSRQMTSKGAVFIADNVWIGDKATVLPGVHIGEGSIVGANSVVAHDVPPYSIVAGVPARILKHITNEL